MSVTSLETWSSTCPDAGGELVRGHVPQVGGQRRPRGPQVSEAACCRRLSRRSRLGGWRRHDRLRGRAAPPRYPCLRYGRAAAESAAAGSVAAAGWRFPPGRMVVRSPVSSRWALVVGAGRGAHLVHAALSRSSGLHHRVRPLVSSWHVIAHSAAYRRQTGPGEDEQRAGRTGRCPRPRLP